MADEPPRTGQDGPDPPARWPNAPAQGSEGGGTPRPPSAPPAGSGGTAQTPPWAREGQPWAQPASRPAPAPAPGGGPGRGSGPLAALRTRRGMVVAGVAAVVLVVAIGGVVLLGGRGGGGDKAGDGAGAGRGARSSAPAAAAGKDIALLDGRLVVAAPEGWEQRDSSADTASLKVELRLPGRDLVGTLITSALPAGDSLDGLLTAPDSTRFELETKGAGTLQGSVVAATGNVRAGVLRPNATFFITLSVFALGGPPLDGPVLQKLFTDQVAPQLRIP